MKKVFITVLMLSVILVSTTVMAYSFTLSLGIDKNVVEQGDNIEIKISMTDLDVQDPGINILEAILEYDKTIFEPITASKMLGLNGWSNPDYSDSTGIFLIKKDAYTKNNQDIVSITFKVRDNATLGDTTIKVKNAVTSDGTNDINAVADVIKTITIQDATNNNNNNTNTNNNININTNANVNNLPKTGAETTPIIVIGVLMLISIVSVIRYKSIKF